MFNDAFTIGAEPPADAASTTGPGDILLTKASEAPRGTVIMDCPFV